MTTPAEIHYLADSDVDDALDRELRELLSTCFTKPQDHVFRERRYFNELPAHRWIIRDGAGGFAAHIAVHDKIVLAGDRRHRIGGIAEVCVHPAHQGNGHVKKLVAGTHAWMKASGMEYGVLFGEPRYYASSGYVAVDNLCYRDDLDERGRPKPAIGALVASLSGAPWPSDGPVYLPGPVF